MGQMGPTRDLGPCRLELDGVSLGETKGGTHFRHSMNAAPVNEDRWGTSPVDKVFTGDSVEVETYLTRQTLAELANVLPGASGTGSTATAAVVRSCVGMSQMDYAGQLVLKPFIGNIVSTDSSQWLTIYKAAIQPDFDVVYDVDTQRVYKVIITGFPVQTKGDPAGTQVGWLYKIGA